MSKVRLKARKEVAAGTAAFYFERPQGFHFIAGQSIDLTLVSPSETDAEGNTRAFSLASAPQESDLMVATRLRDTAFKRVLQSMSYGSELDLEGPFGSLTLHDNDARPAVFLAGGIGITPFRSIILDALDRRLSHRILLFHANRRPEDAAFLEEFRRLESLNSNLTFVPTMSRPELGQRAWKGATGHIRKETLESHLRGLTAPLYYVVGPPGMVAAMQTLLREMGVKSEDIRTEEFSGY